MIERLMPGSPDRWTVIHPLQWPGSGQTTRPRAAMLLHEMARQAINTPKGDSNDNDNS